MISMRIDAQRSFGDILSLPTVRSVLAEESPLRVERAGALECAGCAPRVAACFFFGMLAMSSTFSELKKYNIM
jgi:hypothetical protein